MNRILVLLLCSVLVSCKTSEKIVYFQDVEDGQIEKISVYQGIVIQPKDIISIVVSSRNPELVVSFNKPFVSYQAGSSSASSYSSYRVLGYLVDTEGDIEYPLLGKLRVTGMTREQVSAMIQQRLVAEGFVNDAIVTTEVMNFKISVLGEVRSPGRFDLQDDRITILEAIARAGDLTIYGRRDNVLVTREQNGVIHSYRVDLRSSALIHSPVFYLQQNDVVYVTPNNTVAANSRINQNRTLGVSISLASFLTNLTLLVLNLMNN